MNIWRAYLSTTNIVVDSVMALIEVTQVLGVDISEIMVGDCIEFYNFVDFLSEGKVRDSAGDSVTIVSNSFELVMSKNTSSDKASMTKTLLRSEDWTIRNIKFNPLKA